MIFSSPTQDTQSTTVLPEDNVSVLMDDTSSQWSAAADTEEERSLALEKSVYVMPVVLASPPFFSYVFCIKDPQID